MSVVEPLLYGSLDAVQAAAPAALAGDAVAPAVAFAVHLADGRVYYFFGLMQAVAALHYNDVRSFQMGWLALTSLFQAIDSVVVPRPPFEQPIQLPGDYVELSCVCARDGSVALGDAVALHHVKAPLFGSVFARTVALRANALAPASGPRWCAEHRFGGDTLASFDVAGCEEHAYEALRFLFHAPARKAHLDRAVTGLLTALVDVDTWRVAHFYMAADGKRTFIVTAPHPAAPLGERALRRVECAVALDEPLEHKDATARELAAVYDGWAVTRAVRVDMERVWGAPDAASSVARVFALAQAYLTGTPWPETRGRNVDDGFLASYGLVDRLKLHRQTDVAVHEMCGAASNRPCAALRDVRLRRAVELTYIDLHPSARGCGHGQTFFRQVLVRGTLLSPTVAVDAVVACHVFAPTVHVLNKQAADGYVLVQDAELLLRALHGRVPTWDEVLPPAVFEPEELLPVPNDRYRRHEGHEADTMALHPRFRCPEAGRPLLDEGRVVCQGGDVTLSEEEEEDVALYADACAYMRAEFGGAARVRRLVVRAREPLTPETDRVVRSWVQAAFMNGDVPVICGAMGAPAYDDAAERQFQRLGGLPPLRSLAERAGPILVPSRGWHVVAPLGDAEARRQAAWTQRPAVLAGSPLKRARQERERVLIDLTLEDDDL